MSNDNLDLDLDILDKNLDDIEDLPGFEVPVNGEYNLRMKMAMKTVNDKPAVETAYEVVECIKKNNDADKDTAPGTKFSALYFLSGDPDAVNMSLGRLKQLMAGPAESLGEGNLKILIRDHFASPVNVTATVTRRADKEDKERFYAQVKNLKLA